MIWCWFFGHYWKFYKTVKLGKVKHTMYKCEHCGDIKSKIIRKED